MELELGKIEGLSELNRTIANYVTEIGADAYDEARIAGRNLAVALAKYTAPRGDKKSDAHPGTRKVAADIRRVYATAAGVYKMLKPVDEVRAGMMWAAYVDRKYVRVRKALQGTKFEDMLVQATIAPELHQSARKRGEVNKNYRARQMVYTAKRRATYIRQRQRKVGLAKSGWAHAAKELGGTRGIPAWAGVGRHKLTLGGAQKVKKGLNPGVVIDNHARHIRPSTKVALMATAVKDTQYRLLKRLKIAVRRKEFGSAKRRRRR